MAFLVFLALQPLLLPVIGRWEAPLRVAGVSVFLWVFSRHLLQFGVKCWLGSVGIGAAVFIIWIAPDALFHYRDHWLFQNPIMGAFESSLPEALRGDPLFLTFRTLRAAIVVPMVEELFWRAWLMRWLVSHNFEALPLGTYVRPAFWLTAVLFAAEHGPQWEVGLLAGIAYNWWMIRTRSLADCILAHAVTNACLSAYVILTGSWEYWL